MFLRPSPLLNDLLEYLLAVAVERFEVLLHAHCFLSNHFHLVLTDPDGSLPAFEQYLASLVARSCNALLRHRESFWSPGSYSAVRLLEPSDVLDKAAYTLNNPVAAGLVRHASEWPGLRASLDAIGGPPSIVKRPEFFFRTESTMPLTASLRLVPPPGFDSPEQFREMLGGEIARREEEAAQKLAAEGRAFAGVRAVLAQDPFATPATPQERSTINPRIACRDEAKRKDALAGLKAFLLAYREAWLEFASGVRDVVFPLGTYWMQVAYGLPCAQAG